MWPALELLRMGWPPAPEWLPAGGWTAAAANRRRGAPASRRWRVGGRGREAERRTPGPWRQLSSMGGGRLEGAVARVATGERVDAGAGLATGGEGEAHLALSSS